jgi:hypothetical protein
LQSSLVSLLAEPEGPNHGGDGLSFRTSKGDTIGHTITAHNDQCKGDLITAEVENPLQVEWKKAR